MKIEDKVSLLKLACFNPFPKDSINKFLEKTEEILIVEELEPVIEEAVKTIAFEGGKKIRIYGKSSGHFPETGYFLPDDVRAAIAGLWLKEGSPGFSKNPKAEPLKMSSIDYRLLCREAQLSSVRVVLIGLHSMY